MDYPPPLSLLRGILLSSPVLIRLFARSPFNYIKSDRPDSAGRSPEASICGRVMAKKTKKSPSKKEEYLRLVQKRHPRNTTSITGAKQLASSVTDSDMAALITLLWNASKDLPHGELVPYDEIKDFCEQETLKSADQGAVQSGCVAHRRPEADNGRFFSYCPKVS